MKKPTLAQGQELLGLITKCKVSRGNLQQLLESGMLADLLESNPRLFTRESLQATCRRGFVRQSLPVKASYLDPKWDELMKQAGFASVSERFTKEKFSFWDTHRPTNLHFDLVQCSVAAVPGELNQILQHEGSMPASHSCLPRLVLALREQHPYQDEMKIITLHPTESNEIGGEPYWRPVLCFENGIEEPRIEAVEFGPDEPISTEYHIFGYSFKR